MHISEGVLSAQVLGAGAIVAAAGLAVGLRKLSYHKIPEVAVLSSAFFVASLVHVPVGPGNLHLTLNGLVGLLLGWTAVPSILVALALQALLFQFGGITTLGINTVIMAAPAVLVGLMLSGMLKGKRATLAGALAGWLATAMSTALLAGALALSGEQFVPAAKLLAVAHLPAIIVEAAITASVVSFLAKVKPELLEVAR